MHTPQDGAPQNAAPKIAVLFAGQGAQFPGMGKSLYEQSPAARAVFDLADRLRPGTSEQCFSGDAETLSQTENTQPCLFAVGLAAAAALAEQGIGADFFSADSAVPANHPAALPASFCAGFSLGELPALAYAGVLAAKAAFSLTLLRAGAMAKAAAAHPGKMAAILKLSPQDVESLCAGYGEVWPVNYNSPAQTVIAGSPASVDAVCEAAREKRGKAVPLPVSGAFHTPFMEPVSRTLSDALSACHIHEPAVPLCANVTADFYAAETARGLIARQVCSPVRFLQTVERLGAEGAEIFIEVGPGKTLSGLVRRILPDAAIYSVCEYEEAAAVCEAVRASRKDG